MKNVFKAQLLEIKHGSYADKTKGTVKGKSLKFLGYDGEVPTLAQNSKWIADDNEDFADLNIVLNKFYAVTLDFSGKIINIKNWDETEN